MDGFALIITGGDFLPQLLHMLALVCEKAERVLIATICSNSSSSSVVRMRAAAAAGVAITAQCEYFRCSVRSALLQTPRPLVDRNCSSSAASRCDIIDAAELRRAGQGVLRELQRRSCEAEVHLSPAQPDAINSNIKHGASSWTRQVLRYTSADQGDDSASDSVVQQGSTIVPLRCSSLGTYVITGGTGALGIAAAEVLVAAGAQHVLLVSRSGQVPRSADAASAQQQQQQRHQEVLQQRLDSLLARRGETDGCCVVQVQCCDVSDEAQVVQMLHRARAMSPQQRIAGIIHAAGVLRDGLIRTGNAGSGSAAVWSAKATAAYWLHKHTIRSESSRSSGDALNFFVTFSSLAAGLGSTGQSAYSAANRFLEWLTDQRLREGCRNTLCIRWPAVAGAGMAASARTPSSDASHSIDYQRVGSLLQMLLRTRGGADCSTNAAGAELWHRGTVTLVPAKAMVAWRDDVRFQSIPIEENRSCVDAQAAAAQQFLAAGVMPQRLGAAPAAGGAATAHIVTAGSDSSSTAAATTAAVAEPVTRERIAAVVQQHAQLLLEDPSMPCPADVPLMTRGLDSLGATELAARLSEQFGVALPPASVFSYPTIALTAAALEDMLLPKPGTETSTSAAPAAGAAAAAAAAGSLEDIAIIGTSMSLPGDCSSLPRLWEILLHGESTSVPVPADRWDADALMRSRGIASEPKVRQRLQRAHLLTRDEPFDALEFSMTAREGAVIHPAQRLLLLNARRALQDAGYFGDSLCPDTGVYVGVGGVLNAMEDHSSVQAPTTAAAAGFSRMSGSGSSNSSVKTKKTTRLTAYAATASSTSVSHRI